MSGVRVALDTSAAVAILNDEAAATAAYSQEAGVALPAVAAGELLQLKQIGKMIPENDLWIAASALRHGLTLVIRDQHFGRCSALSLENWLVPEAPDG
jgi:predicted nucleic acid-binding protein